MAAALVVSACGGGDEPPAAGKAGTPVEASELSGLARSLRQPVYWAGPQESTRFELTRSGADRVYVRYLPRGAATAPENAALTVGTYRVEDAHEALLREGRKPGARTYRVAGGGRAVVVPSAPKNVFLAFRGKRYQVEVFDPEAGRALRLARRGEIEPVPGSP